MKIEFSNKILEEIVSVLKEIQTQTENTLVCLPVELTPEIITATIEQMFDEEYSHCRLINTNQSIELDFLLNLQEHSFKKIYELDLFAKKYCEQYHKTFLNRKYPGLMTNISDN
jgi:hypothetical protein